MSTCRYAFGASAFGGRGTLRISSRFVAFVRPLPTPPESFDQTDIDLAYVSLHNGTTALRLHAGVGLLIIAYAR